jgi:hypothetical protein
VGGWGTVSGFDKRGCANVGTDEKIFSARRENSGPRLVLVAIVNPVLIGVALLAV